MTIITDYYNDGIRLRVIVRDKKSSLNRFVRCTPSTVNRLAAGTSHETNWQWFLPLEIRDSTTGERVYASYNGGDINFKEYEFLREEEVDTCLDVPYNLLPEHFHDVNVRVLENVGVAQTLWVEPLEMEDWELLELDATWLEDHGLLQQISLVYANQIIPLYLSNGVDVARVRVLENRNFSESAQIWPLDDPCLQLKAETQIVVVPKSQPRTDVSTLRVCLTYQDCNESERRLADHLKNVSLVHVEQCTAVVHPQTLSQKLVASHMIADPNYIGILVVKSTEDTTTSVVVRIQSSTDVTEECIAIHPFIRWKLKIMLNSTVTLEILSSFQVKNMSSFDLKSCKCFPFKIQRIALDFPIEASWKKPISIGRDFLPVSSAQGQPVIRTEDLFEWPDSMLDIPIQHDTIVSLPGTTNSFQSLYRILFEIDPSDDTKDSSKFVFARDMRNLLRRSDKSFRLEGSLDVVIKEPYYLNVTQELMGCRIKEDVIFTPQLLSGLHSVVHRSSILIYGEEGSGKTHTALTVASSFRLRKGYHIAYINCRALKDSSNIRMSTLLSELTAVFDEACKMSPCAIVLDDLDEIIASHGENGASDDSSQFYQVNPVELDQSKLVVDCLRLLLYRLKSQRCTTAVIVTCRNEQTLPQACLSDFEFAEKLPILPMDENERFDFYQALVQKLLRGPWKPDSSWQQDFGRKTKGFRPRDLEQIAARVTLKLEMPLIGTLEIATFRELEDFVPISRTGISTEKMTKLCWSDIGGLFKTKSELTSSVLKPTTYHRIYNHTSIRLPRGILLFGFPGSGKSICVPALADICGFPLIICRGAELLDKYIGASEAKVRELFSRAASAAPSILFFDELDALAPRRGSDHTGVTDRIVNQLLTFLDGVEDTANIGQVYVIAATSRPDKIDPALLRPGRLEKHIFVGYPEGIEEWTDLLRKVASRYNVDNETLNCISSGNFIRRAVTETSVLSSHLSAADVKAAFQTAQLSAIHEALRLGHKRGPVTIRKDHIRGAFLAAKPSLPKSDYQKLSEIYSDYRHQFHTRPPSAADIASGSTSPDRPLRTALK